MTVANECQSCHMGQNANATSAVDMTGITTIADMTAQTNACNQVRTRVNFQTVAQSGVLLAPEAGGAGAPPLKLSGAATPTHTNFSTAVPEGVAARGRGPWRTNYGEERPSAA